MCRLYGFKANEATKVECTLVHAQNALMVQAASDEVGKEHGHGWGLATFDGGRPVVQKRAWAAYHGEHFPRAAAQVFAHTVVAHVRRATVGAPALENTHPFTDDRWVMAHNGTISGFDVVKERILEATAADRRSEIHGTTDSEHFFQYLMSLLDAQPALPPADVLVDAIRQIREWVGMPEPRGFGINLVWTDGDTLLATRLGRGLWYTRREGVRDCEVCGFPHVHHDARVDYRAVVVASEPIGHREHWEEVPEGSLVQVDEAFNVGVRPLA